MTSSNNASGNETSIAPAGGISGVDVIERMPNLVNDDAGNRLTEARNKWQSWLKNTSSVINRDENAAARRRNRHFDHRWL